jgi:hypothetical protein
VLGDKETGKEAMLKPASERWVKQFGVTRPLQVRLGKAGSLHDRLIFIDAQGGDAVAWQELTILCSDSELHWTAFLQVRELTNRSWC